MPFAGAKETVPVVAPPGKAEAARLYSPVKVTDEVGMPAATAIEFAWTNHRENRARTSLQQASAATTKKATHNKRGQRTTIAFWAGEELQDALAAKLRLTVMIEPIDEMIAPKRVRSVSLYQIEKL